MLGDAINKKGSDCPLYNDASKSEPAKVINKKTGQDYLPHRRMNKSEPAKKILRIKKYPLTIIQLRVIIIRG